MFVLKTEHVLFMQWILSGLVTFSCSMKTYQVNQLNDSSYIVTSLPDTDYPYITKPKVHRFVPINIGNYNSTPNLVAVGERKYLKPKIPESIIKQGREMYFSKYYATLNKPSISSPLYSSKLFPKGELTAFRAPNPLHLQENLQVARKLASRLIVELKNDALRKQRENLQSIRRKVRHVIKPDKYLRMVYSFSNNLRSKKSKQSE